jgi:hypothetical protein
MSCGLHRPTYDTQESPVSFCTYFKNEYFELHTLPRQLTNSQQHCKMLRAVELKELVDHSLCTVLRNTINSIFIYY